MMPTMGRKRASSEYPRALMKTFLRNREKCASPYEVRPCRKSDVEATGVDIS